MAKRVMTQATQALLKQVLDLPPEERVTLVEELKSRVTPGPNKPRNRNRSPAMKAGCLPGFRMAPDFDEPLKDFEGYVS